MAISPWRIALVAGGGALLAAWLAAATTAPREAVAEQTPTPSAAPPVQREEPASSAAVGLSTDFERLRDRVAEAPALRVSPRNPFSLAAPPPPPGPPTLAPAPERVGRRTVSRPPGRTGPAHSLIGVASRYAEEAPERIGILMAPDGEVFLVGAGDRVPGGYLVDAVEPSSVTLVDGAGVRHRLVLP